MSSVLKFNKIELRRLHYSPCKLILWPLMYSVMSLYYVLTLDVTYISWMVHTVSTHEYVPY